MILVIDNYDSFTYNLVQFLASWARRSRSRATTKSRWTRFARWLRSRLSFRPGPGTPDDGGISLQVIRELGPTTPILGVCLGNQCIGQACGGVVKRAGRLMHGKTSMIHHRGDPIFAGIDNPFVATRYHSLIVEQETLPEALDIIAWTDRGEIMGLRHREQPLVGLQFHPESILTADGPQILQNFLDMRA